MATPFVPVDRDGDILRPGPRLTGAWVLSWVVLVLMAVASAAGLVVDGIYTEEEQSAAINALYDVARGKHQHLGIGRRARVGLEINF